MGEVIDYPMAEITLSTIINRKEHKQGIVVDLKHTSEYNDKLIKALMISAKRTYDVKNGKKEVKEASNLDKSINIERIKEIIDAEIIVAQEYKQPLMVLGMQQIKKILREEVKDKEWEI